MVAEFGDPEAVERAAAATFNALQSQTAALGALQQAAATTASELRTGTASYWPRSSRS